MTTIESFYCLQSPDNLGRKLSDYWAADDEWLENTHNYIQWMFPLQEKSAFNMNSPILSEEDRLKCIWNEEVYNNLCTSFNTMTVFYGLWRTTNHSPRIQRWVTPGNHNFLRMTRILKSCMLLGAEPQARFLFRRLEEIYKDHSEIITGKAMNFWCDAVGK